MRIINLLKKVCYRTNDYGFGDVRIPVLKTMKKEGVQEGSEDHQTKPGSRIPDLNKMNSEREEKMARFRSAALIKYLYK